MQDPLRQLSSDPEGAGKFDRDKWAAQLTPILTLWSKLSQQCEPLKQLPAGRPNAEGTSPVDTIIALEIAKAKSLLKLVDDSTGAIGRVVRGTELLDASTKSQGNALVQGTVPSAWEALWEGPTKPDTWMNAVASRIVALARWQQASSSGQLLREPLRLSELLSPSFFLTALRQQTARQAKVPMDSVAPYRRPSSRSYSVARLCAFRSTACCFRAPRVRLRAVCIPCQRTRLPFCRMPPVHIAWVPTNAQEPYDVNLPALLPLYLDPEREVQLGELRLTGQRHRRAGCRVRRSS